MPINPTVLAKPMLSRGAGSPNGSVTPVASGQLYVDTTAGVVYVAVSTSNTSWRPISPQYGSASLGVTFGGSSSGVTTSTAELTWTRLGDRIVFDATVVLTARGSHDAAAAVAITGLPFQSASNVYCETRLTNMASGVGETDFFTRIVSGASSANPERMGTSGSSERLTWSDFAANSQVFFSGAYRVA